MALTFARIHAGLGDAVPCTGMLSHAVLCTDLGAAVTAASELLGVGPLPIR